MRGMEESRLHEAALKGSVESLKELLQEDPLLLDRVIIDCPPETPLHVAATLGHIDFAKEVVRRKPELAREIDSEGHSPLHLASAKGHLQLARVLLSVDPDTCLSTDQDGRTPLHLAAMKGRVAVLDDLIEVNPEASQVLTDRGETVLHLCVKHNRFDALKLLLKREEPIQKVEFLNRKDHDGNTILHLALAKKQIETIKFLLNINGIKVNTFNANGFTALDVLVQSQGDAKDMEIGELLRGAGGLRGKDIQPSTEYNWLPDKVGISAVTPTQEKQGSSSKQKDEKKHRDWLGRKKSALMVVASLIATVAFQAGVSPPGGVWQDELATDANGNPAKNPHHVGRSVMAYEKKREYGQFMIFNTIGFLASLSIILLLVSGLPLKRRRWMWIQMVIMWIAITAMAVTYFITLDAMTPDHARRVLFHVNRISVLTWLGLMGFLFIVHVLRMTTWSMGKVKEVKEKRRHPKGRESFSRFDNTHEFV